MSYPATSITYPDKYMNMTTSEYIHPSLHFRPPTGHHETTFRWPHNGNGNERTSTYGHSQYMNEKNGSSRIDFRYSDLKYPYDPRGRHDVAVMHEDQQRIHDIHMQQYPKNVNEIRSTPPDMRLSGNDVRTSFLKKGMHDSQTHEMRFLFDETRIPYEYPKPAFNSNLETRHPSNGVVYPFPTPPNVRPPFTDIRHHYNNTGNEEVVVQPLPSDSPPQLEPLEKESEPARNTPAVEEEKEFDFNLKSSNVQCTAGTNQSERDADAGPSSSMERECTDSATSSLDMNKEYLSLQQDNLNVNSPCQKEEDGPLENPPPAITQKTLSDLPETKKQVNEAAASEKESVSSDSSPTDDTKSIKDGNNPDNGLPSYTAMIAQAILKKEGNKSTLSDIYEYMEKHFPSLERRGTGWRNCVRHTLSLNDCFIKLHRPENGRSCNWAIHPSYFESFSRGDYRKRRAFRKRPRGLQWIDPIMLAGYPFMREHDIHPELGQQQSPFYHYPPAPAMWNSPQSGYNSSINQPSPNHLQHYPQPPPPPNMHPLYPGHPNHAGHVQSNHCTNPDCYCQFNKNNCRVYTP